MEGVSFRPALGGQFCTGADTPYTPERNGMIERFFRNLKEECVWQHNFRSFAEARQAINRWIEHYNEERPHQSLGYLSPRQYRERQQVQLVA